MDANGGRVFPSSSPEFLRDLWIAETIFVEAKQVQVQPVLHFTLTQIVQARLPVSILGQIFRHVCGQKNMPCIATIQHPLRDIDSRSCKVRFVVNIGDPIDRAAVNSHPHLNMRMPLQRSANLESTSHRFFRTVEEKERHPVAGWHSIEFAACFRRSKGFRSAHDLLQLLQQFNLFVDQQF